MAVALPSSYGWVGLGAMGYPMATQLRKKIPQSTELTIFDIDLSALQRFVRDTQGLGKVTIASNAKELAEKSECVISMVPEGEAARLSARVHFTVNQTATVIGSHVKSVYMASGVGLLAAADTSGKLFIDCSTIDPATSLAVGKAVAESRPTNPPRFFDAPVSGGTAGAEKAILTFMVGAAPDDPSFPVMKEIFSYMGSFIHPMGGPSLGLAAKLSNNYLSGLIALATSEAMNLGMRLGLDPHVLSDCFKTSSGGSWVNSTVNPVPGVCPDAVTSKGYEGGFKIQLMKKDMSLAVDAAHQVGAKLVLAEAGLSAYSAAAQDPRCVDKDSRVVYRWLGGIEPETENKPT